MRVVFFIKGRSRVFSYCPYAQPCRISFSNSQKPKRKNDSREEITSSLGFPTSSIYCSSALAGVSYDSLARFAEQNKCHGRLPLVHATMSRHLQCRIIRRIGRYMAWIHTDCTGIVDYLDRDLSDLSDLFICSSSSFYVFFFGFATRKTTRILILPCANTKQSPTFDGGAKPVARVA